MAVLSKLEPKAVFSYFEYLSSVPHGSGNTKQVSDLCVRFAREHGLRCRQDALNNVIIWKDASPGYEGAAPVILQGHLDMVCAKDPGCPIDMAAEPIRLCTDGERVWAEGTSLGGDDGIAVAMALAVLADDSLPHPALEAFVRAFGAVLQNEYALGDPGWTPRRRGSSPSPVPAASGSTARSLRLFSRSPGSSAVRSASPGFWAATPVWRSTRAAPTQTT